ncbi:MAG: alpha/beta fold hydrolase [Gammaproteobacteria bacterium]|nr:alpha/beta fold hydrolase [Gammaproteobacteria bacterium]
MESQRLSQLIGLIYDSAVDLDLWPMLLQGLMAEIDDCVRDENRTMLLPSFDENIGEYVSRWYDSHDNDALVADADDNVRYFSSSENELFGLLLPHLRRAVKINRDFVELKSENQAFASVLERLPIGMVVVDADARVYAKNRRFDSILQMKQGLRIHSGNLQASKRDDSAKLIDLFQEIITSPEEDTVGRAMRLSGSSPASLLILPLIHADTPHSARLIIFVASLSSDINIEIDTLKNMYGLTPAESRLAISLVKGATLDESSEAFSVSRHTLRTQLKSIYAKTGCRRQAELMVKILTSPAILTSQESETALPAIALEENLLLTQQRLSQSVFLKDGRRLSYAEYGPSNGAPVIFMHSIAGSRLQIPEDEEILYDKGIRLLVPERPGIGLSDAKKKRTILDWSEDVAEFADCKEIEKFRVMSNSVGSCFALAAAHELPQRVESVTLLSPMSEFYNIDELDGIIPIFKMILGLGKYVPSITLPFMRLAVRGLLRNPDKYYASIVEQMPDADYKIFTAPGFREKYLPTALEALRNGERGVTVEQLMVARKWGFSLGDINVPVSIWHGEEDRHNPLYMAKSIQAELADAKLNVIPGGGHFLLYSHWPQIIESMVPAK